MMFPVAWWLSALALPVIALYLLKTRQRRRDVSTLLFWDVLKPKVENSPLWRKLRRWLSLLLQLLILFLLVAALARPAFDWEKYAPRRVVAILDPSASMQALAPGRWAAALAGLESDIARMRVQDEMALLTAENPPRILSGWTSSKRELRNALSLAVPVPTGTDPAPAFDLAGDLTTLRENSSAAIFSDSVWPGGSWDKPLPNARIHGLSDASPTNAGFTLFAIRRSPVVPGDWQLDAEITSTQPFTGTVELLRDGQPMDLVECTGAWKKTWRGSSEAGARFEARLKTSDVLPLDDSAACTLPPLARLNVLVAGAPDAYLEAALASIPLVSRWIEKTCPKDPMRGTDLIIAIGDAAPESAGSIPVLLIHPKKSGFWGTATGKLTDAAITEVQKTSPLVRHAGLGNVVVDRAERWQPAPGSEVLAASMGSPLVFGHWDREPRWLVVGFDPADSDLPLRTAFPILMSNLLQSLRSRDDAKLAAAVLPGPVESRLVPLVREQPEMPADKTAWISVPGWWLLTFAALLVVVAEWYLFSRRITD